METAAASAARPPGSRGASTTSSASGVVEARPPSGVLPARSCGTPPTAKLAGAVATAAPGVERERERRGGGSARATQRWRRAAWGIGVLVAMALQLDMPERCASTQRASTPYSRPCRSPSSSQRPHRRGELPAGAHTGAAGGAACGDLVRLSVALDGERVGAAAFDAQGCAAAMAAASAAAALAEGSHLLDAARIGPRRSPRELGGLSPARRHAAELAADALHRALGAARARGSGARALRPAACSSR